jgi:hypothetical protein
VQARADALSAILPYIDGLSIVGIVTGTAKLFEWLDGLLNDAGREAIGRWIRRVPSEWELASWPSEFSRVIDTVFGTRALSLRFFGRSCIASGFTTIIALLIYLRISLDHYAFNHLLLLTVFISCIPGYLSLLIGRTIVRKMARSPTAFRVGVLLVFELCLACQLAGLFTFLGISIYKTAKLFGVFTAAVYPMLFIKAIFSELPDFLSFRWIVFNQERSTKSIFQSDTTVVFYTIVFASIWVWISVGLGILINVFRKMKLLWDRSLPYIDVDKKPLGAIGRIAGLLLGFVYAAFLGGL